MQPFLLRRRKADVLKELPPKEENVRRISLSEEEWKTYCACVQAMLEKLRPEEGGILNMSREDLLALLDAR